MRQVNYKELYKAGTIFSHLDWDKKQKEIDKVEKIEGNLLSGTNVHLIIDGIDKSNDYKWRAWDPTDQSSSKDWDLDRYVIYDPEDLELLKLIS